MDAWRERSIPVVEALVALIKGAWNEVECYTAALAPAEVLHSCLRLRTEDAQLAVCLAVVTSGGSPPTSETSVALVMATFSVFTF